MTKNKDKSNEKPSRIPNACIVTLGKDVLHPFC